MLGAILSAISKLILPLAERWFLRRDARKLAQSEMDLEVSIADRAKANEIRDRIDGARLGGGVHPDQQDGRGYRD